MSRFELPNGVRDSDSILNEYRSTKWRANHTGSYLNFDAIVNLVDEQSTRYPVEGDNMTNSSSINLHGDNDKPRHSRLDEIAEALRTLTYGEMLELAESMWKVNSQGSEITESALPNVLYRWSKSRSIPSIQTQA
jgi:hypothetical protein